MSDGLIRCWDCKHDKPPEAFAPAKLRRKDYHCGECRKAEYRAYYHEHRDTMNKRAIARQHNTTVDVIEGMRAAQHDVCAICKRPETHMRNEHTIGLSVDHDHATGKLRGLLCFRCNTTLGRVNDNPELLEQMAAYLRRTSCEDLQ